MTKSLLRWPGGKTRAVDTLLRLIPAKEKVVISPFFGGGSVEFALAARGVQIYGYDISLPLVNFWNAVFNNAIGVAERVKLYHPLSKERFNQIKADMKAGVSKDAIAEFYVLNRASFGGAGIYGGFQNNHPRFTDTAIDRLARFKCENIHVSYRDFRDTITQSQGRFMYCDPPYAIDSVLYEGHAGFNHGDLAMLLKPRPNWILSYNDCDYVRDLYAGHLVIKPKWTYGIGKNKSGRELLIFSKDRKAL